MRFRCCAAAANARTGAEIHHCADSGRTSRRRPQTPGRPIWPTAPAARSRPVAPPSASTPGIHAGPGRERRRRAAPRGRACRRRARPARRRTNRRQGRASERAGTTALTTRWIGTKASSSVHHHRRQREGSHGPDTVSTAASIAIHRGSSRNCERSVSSRSDRSKCHLRGGDAVAGDRQRNERDERRPPRTPRAASTAARRSSRSGSRTAAPESRGRTPDTPDSTGSASGLRRSRRSTSPARPTRFG